eukprot:gb/GEZN01012618.1/.p1 GENE.gb/GEZN01012618.1/~~gb/GEZN01012618.1/.p1  ORF type:complete len:292 (+),score=12.49 gb/GEZN01012618.1/:37-876(+)
MCILLITYLATFVSVGTIKVYLYGIRYFALSRGLRDPLDNYFLEMTWRGIKRSKRVAPDERIALTLAMLRKAARYVISLIKKTAVGACHDLITVVTIMVWGTVALLRIGELVLSGHAGRTLKDEHVQRLVQPRKMLRLKIDGSKTDPFRSGIVVPLAAQDEECICPVYWHDHYVKSRAALTVDMREISSFFVWSIGLAVTRDSFVTKARRLLVEVGCKEAERFNGISLRRGGAKMMAMAGASESSIMRAGRWTSGAYRRYIQCDETEIMDGQLIMAKAM